MSHGRSLDTPPTEPGTVQEISLAGAEEKLTQLDAALKPSVIHLGLPTVGQIAGRSNTL